MAVTRVAADIPRDLFRHYFALMMIVEGVARSSIISARLPFCFPSLHTAAFSGVSSSSCGQELNISELVTDFGVN